MLRLADEAQNRHMIRLTSPLSLVLSPHLSALELLGKAVYSKMALVCRANNFLTLFKLSRCETGILTQFQVLAEAPNA